MVGRRGRSSAGKGIIKLDMTLDYTLAFKKQEKSFVLLKKYGSHLSFARAGHPLARTKTPHVRQLSSGLGRRHRIGAGRRGAMGTAGSWRTSSGQNQDRSACGQIQVPEIIAPQHNATIYPAWAKLRCFEARPLLHDARSPVTGDRIYIRNENSWVGLFAPAISSF